MEKITRKPTRVVIFIKDIQAVTGLKAGRARLLYHRIRRHYRKEQTQFVTADEFCQFTGIKEEMIRQQLAL